MSRKYFGTDGIRGTVGALPITPDFMLRLGHAVGHVLRRTTDKPSVLIGKDTRISGYMLESALEAGFASAGVDVLLSGPLPTPGVAYLTRALRLDLGVVISASHNAFADNGVKFFSARGEKLPDDWEIEVEAALAEHRADYGIALDGDADRLQVVDAQGRLFNGDELLYVMTMDRMAQQRPVQGVVGTLMTNMAVEQALSRRGVQMVRAKVGDRYVLEELAARGWCLGGESSGHLLALDRHTTGDGIVSALQILQAVRRSGGTLDALLEDVTLYPQTLINVRLRAGSDWQQNAALTEAHETAVRELGDEGRVLIRASGTEPVLRVMVEARDAALGKQCAERMAAAAAAG